MMRFIPLGLLLACTPETTSIDDAELDEPGQATEGDTAAVEEGDTATVAEEDTGEACQPDEPCAWPTQILVHTVVNYDANELAETFGITDCVLELEGALPEGATGSDCPDCDLHFQGQVAYDLGSCPEDYISTPNPLTYGVVFIDEDTREFWTRDPDIWEYLGETTRTPEGGWNVTTVEPVLYEVPLLGDAEVGTFTIQRLFTDG